MSAVIYTDYRDAFDFQRYECRVREIYDTTIPQTFKSPDSMPLLFDDLNQHTFDECIAMYTVRDIVDMCNQNRQIENMSLGEDEEPPQNINFDIVKPDDVKAILKIIYNYLEVKRDQRSRNPEVNELCNRCEYAFKHIFVSATNPNTFERYYKKSGHDCSFDELLAVYDGRATLSRFRPNGI
jgi:hypothetical protein